MNIRVLLSRAFSILCLLAGIIAIFATLKILKRLRSYFLQTKLPQKSVHYKLTFTRLFKSITPLVGCASYSNKQFDLPLPGHLYLLVWDISLLWTLNMYFSQDEFTILIPLVIGLSSAVLSILANSIFILTFVADFNSPINPRPKFINFEFYLLVSALVLSANVLFSQFYTGSIVGLYAFSIGLGMDIPLRAVFAFILAFTKFPDYRSKYYTFAEDNTEKIVRELSGMDLNAMKSSPRLEPEMCSQRVNSHNDGSGEETILQGDVFHSAPRVLYSINNSSPSPEKHPKAYEKDSENPIEEETTGFAPEYTLFKPSTPRGPKIKDTEVKAKILRHYEQKDLSKQQFYHRGNYPDKQNDTNFAIKTKGGTLTIELSEKSESLSNEPAEIVLFVPSKSEDSENSAKSTDIVINSLENSLSRLNSNALPTVSGTDINSGLGNIGIKKCNENIKDDKLIKRENKALINRNSEDGGLKTNKTDNRKQFPLVRNVNASLDLSNSQNIAKTEKNIVSRNEQKNLKSSSYKFLSDKGKTDHLYIQDIDSKNNHKQFSREQNSKIDDNEFAQDRNKESGRTYALYKQENNI